MGHEKNREKWTKAGILGGMLKKGSDCFGLTNSEVVIFLGIKYEPLSDPPSLKIVSGAPGYTRTEDFELALFSSFYTRLSYERTHTRLVNTDDY